MPNSSRLDVTVNGSNSCHTVFHQNMEILMNFNHTSRELTKCFKEGMFAYPNKEGFMQVSYFLLKIIYPDTQAFRDCWPVLDRSQEREFRKAVCEMMRGFNNDFSDIIQFPDVGPSKLLSPGGDRFATIMWKLSLLAMGIQAKRDLGCYLIQPPTEKTPPSLAACSLRNRQIVTVRNIMEIEKTRAAMVSFDINFREMKKASQDRIFEFNAKIKEMESNLQIFDQYELDLKKKLLDLNSEEGISILKERISHKESLLEEQFKSINKCGDIVRDWKGVIEAIAAQEMQEHQFILDSSDIGDRASSNVFTSKFSGAGDGNVSVCDNSASLLDHLRVPCEKLKSLKLNCFKTDSKMHLEEWERICKERQLVESEMAKLEGDLEKMVLELTSYCNQKLEQEKILQVEDQKPLESTSTLSIKNIICASTPIKDKVICTSDGLSRTANITPYQQPSVADHFSKKLERDPAKEIENSLVLPEEIKVDVSKVNKRRSLQDIVERFQRIQERMKQGAVAFDLDTSVDTD